MKIGRYKVEEEISTGGMGVVYRATDPAMNRQVAIKVLAYGLANDDLNYAHFEQEAQLVANLEAHTIVPVYDYGQQGVQPYMVMRFMRGGTLDAFIDGTPLPLSDIVNIINRVAHALDYAHERHILHRDVKPLNILFDEMGQAYLSDFGLAKYMEHAAKMSSHYLVGTAEYMSPEQVEMGPVTPQTDIYALGATLYELLTGELPYQGKSTILTAMAHFQEAVPDLMKRKTPGVLALKKRVRRQAFGALNQLLQQAMAKDPSDRFTTATEMALQLEAISTGRWFLNKLANVT